MKQYNKANIPLARELRRNMTPWERTLWYQFLSKYPVRFQRQKAIGDFIVDFYCAKAKLAIELDGGGHYMDAQMKKDMLRTQKLEGMGVRIVRVCNMDIDKNFRGVCMFLDNEIQKSLPQSASLTAPSSEGASREVRRTIVALGFFDGVHRGHQALLEACCRMAEQYGCSPAAVTFDLPPSAVLLGRAPNMITTLSDRTRLLEKFGMAHVQILPATAATLSQPWKTFLENLTAQGAAGFVCGEDFRFGHGGEGTAEILQAFAKEQGLPCCVVPEQRLDGEKISSTRIRRLIEDGETEYANSLLGHPHILTGTVVPGRQLGRTIGIPTANLQLPPELLTPKFGVYACMAHVEDESDIAVTNIGTRPTVEGEGVTVEAWLPDFQGDLYGKTLTLEFYKFLRPEKKFADLEALKAQIRQDAAETRKVLR